MEAEGQGVTPGRVPPSSLPGWLWSPGDLPGSFPLACVSVQPEEKAVSEVHAHQGWGSSHHTARFSPFQQTSTNPTGCNFPRPTTCREWLGSTGASVTEGQAPAQVWLPQQHLDPLPFSGSACQDLLTPGAEIPPEIPADTVPTGAAALASGTARPQHPSVGSPMPAACWALLLELWVPLHSLWTSGKLPQFAPVAANSAAGARPSTQGVL